MHTIEKLMQSGVEQRVFPGAVLQVFAGKKTVFRRAYGYADIFSKRPMTLDICFDLASLTKPLATVAAVMVLVAQGQLDLDQTCSDVCPEFFGSDKENITLRQLLSHSAGLPAWKPYFMPLRTIPLALRLETLRKLLLTEPLVSKPGEKSDYSDLGYMLIQWIIEKVCGQDLDQFVTHHIYLPLGIDELFFNDTTKSVMDRQRYAATQLCPWRNRLMVGHVDDDNAFMIGGVAGHAGLFGTADAVCRLLQVLLCTDHEGMGYDIFDPVLMDTFFSAPGNDRWALGFDTPSSTGSSAGQYFSSRSVGHLGFTGTSFWMDRQKKIIVVLLTNRVHPWRFNTGIKAFRPILHDAVMKVFLTH